VAQGSELAFNGKVAGQTPDFKFLLQALRVSAAKDEIPVIVVAEATGKETDIRLQAIG
jgi:hypothetical protein